ncbi:anti-sigma factor RsbA family regulatory protein [Saccharothrix isguenensis]
MTDTADLPGLVHQGLIYDTDEQFLAATVPFCLDGLDRDDAVLAVTTTANITLLRDSLGDDARRVEFVDADSWYRAPGRTLAAYHRYVDDRSARHQRIRIIGEPVWHGRDPLATAEWTRYESVINLAFADSAAWIVCPYDTRALPEQVVADARRTHPDLVTGPVAEPSPAYVDPALFCGESEHRPTAGEKSAAGMRFGPDLSAARRFTATNAAALGLPPADTATLVIAVNEVVANAVEHGGGSGRLSLHRAGRRITCDITDNGPSPLTDWFTGYLPPDPARTRGHGLWIVRQLCDLIEIHPTATGTTVRLHLDIT